MKRKSEFVCGLLLACSLASGVARAQTDAPAEQQAASLSGVVSNSLTGEPLAHAQVILDKRFGHTCLFSHTCPSGLTKADGRFSISKIAPGKYELFVERQGYAPLAGDQDRKPLELKSGEDVDLALQLVPYAVISGRVLDAKGIPVERVTVEAVGGGGSPYPAVTDDQGRFRMGRLRAGRYLVRTVLLTAELGPPEIRTDGTAELSCAPTYYPSSASLKSAAPVEARAGEETSGIEIKLQPASMLHVSGTVSEPGGRQGCGSIVSLSGGIFGRRLTTVSDRTFTFWRVPPGRYQVYTGNSPEGPPVEITVTNASIEGLHLLCHEPLELSGHFEVESGLPIPDQKGRTPSLKLLAVGSIEYFALAARLQADSSFRLENVFPGRYHVLGQDLPHGLFVKSAHIGTADLQDGILDLRSTDPKAEMTIQLGANSAEVSGVVRDTKGPAAGAQVALFFDDEYGIDLAATSATGADGSYVLDGVAPGKYKLIAYDPKSSPEVWSSDAMALHESVTENLDVREGDKVLRDLKLLTRP